MNTSIITISVKNVHILKARETWFQISALVLISLMQLEQVNSSSESHFFHVLDLILVFSNSFVKFKK